MSGIFREASRLLGGVPGHFCRPSWASSVMGVSLEGRIFFLLDDVFRLFGCSMVVVQESVFYCNTRVIDQDAWTDTEKALRVPRAVNMVDGLPRACKSYWK